MRDKSLLVCSETRFGPHLKLRDMLPRQSQVAVRFAMLTYAHLTIFATLHISELFLL